MPPTVFTHVVVTAPTVATAEVYRLQLRVLKASLPFLMDATVECVADPGGHRVGSGGGTLNALQFLRSKHAAQLSMCRVLIIHSGGESRRAPLYSLIGKAWTTINAQVDGQDIACPLLLLIKEITSFCQNVPAGSVVVASSDVMLDIVGPHCATINLHDDGVYVVTVPESPETAKNHGVLTVSAEKSVFAGCTVAPAVSYMQKPSIYKLQVRNAIYQWPTGERATTDGATPGFALVDTGVVIFVGAAVEALCHLLDSPVVSTCTDSQYRPSRELPQTEQQSGPALRLELYTDILLALALKGQTDFSLDIYHQRLGLPSPRIPSNAPYDLALPVLWQELSRLPLRVVLIPAGSFEHLGTTAEVLELLSIHSDAATESADARRHRSKLLQFAAKYGLHKCIASRVTESAVVPICVNTFSTPSEEQERLRQPSGTCCADVVVEHSLLSGKIQLPASAIVSHVSSFMGHNLSVNEGIMMQQVYLKKARSINTTPKTDSFKSALQCVVLVLGIADDVKRAYYDGWNTFCCAPWSHWLVTGVAISELWDATVPEADRSIWNAKLYCVASFDHRGHLTVQRTDGAAIDAPLLALTWLQDLPDFASKATLPAEYASAIGIWRSARRLSLADILEEGDATMMFHWRRWLQSAYQKGYALPGRVQLQLGVAKQQADLSSAFTCLMGYSEILARRDINRCRTFPLLLGLWLTRLCLHGADRDAQLRCLTLAVHGTAVEEDTGTERADAEARLFLGLWEEVECLGNPDIGSVIAAFLKGLVLDREDYKVVLRCLQRGCAFFPSTMQTRAVFLAAWLFVGKRGPIDPTVLQASLFPAAQDIGYSAELSVSAILRAMEWTDDSYAADAAAQEEVCEGAERYAQRLVAQDIQRSLQAQILSCSPSGGKDGTSATTATVFAPQWGTVVVTRAPVRIDLAGGWSDTPPICYELSGSVANVAILVDGSKPIRCCAQMIPEPMLELHCRTLTAPGVYSTESFTAQDWENFVDLSCGQKNQKCILLRAVLVALQVVDLSCKGSNFDDELRRRVGGGICILCVSDLPPGSGMGGSSVLAAALLRCVGDLLATRSTQEDLVYQVSQVEQILTTGGGWQDQVGAIYGGFKLGHSPAALPLTVHVSSTGISESFRDTFQRRVCLVYTGQQRLARNTLINALRKSALSPASSPENGVEGDATCCLSTVAALVADAESAWTHICSLCNDTTAQGADDGLDTLADYINRYWELKVEMAAGSEPPRIKALLDRLQPLCVGLSLCGAGAGGFAVVVLKRDFTQVDLSRLVQEINATSSESEGDVLSVHSVRIDDDGIQSTTANSLRDGADRLSLWEHLNVT